MPSSENYPSPAPNTKYLLAYLQGDARAFRDKMKQSFVEAATIHLLQSGRMSWMLDDEYGVIRTDSAKPQREALGL